MKQIINIFQCFICFFSIHSVENYRTQKVSQRTLDNIKQLITLKVQRQIENIDNALLADQIILQRRNPEAKRHHNELSINNPDAYYQGDIDLSEKQAEMLSKHLKSEIVLKEKEDEIIRQKRSVGLEPFYVRWDHRRPISYDFAETIPLETRAKIRAAIAMWEERTCIRFQENGPNIDRIEFFDGGGCSSFVGRTGGTQGISISTPGCDIIGIISHEIGHTLGIFHEQARLDQKNHIFINYNNIPLSRWNNFFPISQHEADMFNLPYDTGSVMHYGPYGFATDPYVPTITTRNKFHQYTIGQREGPSFLDYAAINIAYRCTEHCANIQCDHNGYPNPNNCAKCLCPDGFAGSTCQFVQYTSCGALIKASKMPVTISSPNYPNSFNVGDHCIWLIIAPPGGIVNFQFIEQFQLQCEDTCDKSYVEIKIGADFRLTGYRFCCTKAPHHVFQSITNEMIVIFRGFGDAGNGFRAKVWSNVDYQIVNKTVSNKISEIPEELLKLTIPTVVTTTIAIATTITTTTTATTTSTYARKLRITSIAITSIPANIITTTIAGTVSIPSTITTMPIVTDKNGNQHLCECGEWSEWSGPCTQECGGCGKRLRTRQCSSDVECRTEEKRACAFNVCPYGTNFLINNGEFHILWKGCCVGLFRSGDTCSALDDGENPFLKFLETLLSVQDIRRSRNLPDMTN
uniref:Zinc metalloproteinase n=1 Tax=Brugia malayi TaxID=6279 RepID=A0A1I9G748_BRUMA|nr:BMA-NAS-38, isoform a [Brugia malayi]